MNSNRCLKLENPDDDDKGSWSQGKMSTSSASTTRSIKVEGAKVQAAREERERLAARETKDVRLLLFTLTAVLVSATD
jgi:hypothetical protein